MNTSFQLPEAFSAVMGLGAPRAWFPVRKWNRVGNLVMAVLLLGGALLAFLYGLYDTYTAYLRHGPAVIDDRLLVPMLIAFVLFLLGLLAVWGAYANWNKGAALYDRGFASRDRKGLRTWTWEDVLSLTSAVTRHYTNGIYTGTTHVYTLFNRKREKLVLNDVFKNVDQLAEEIEQKIFPLLYEPASEKYNSGQSLDFGSILISKTGLQIGKKTFAWAEVKDVSLQRGELKISRKDGGWFSGASISAANIPNLRVLLTIIDQVVGLKTG